MELTLKDDIQGVLAVSEHIFGYPFNQELVHQVIVSYLSGARQGTRAQKNRAQVSGSGKKPWRQKGTGRARSGSVKSPIWRSGGVAFAACPKNYNQKVNKKMYRGALKSILSELIRQNRLVVVKEFSLEIPKTKLLVKKLEDINLKNVLIVINIPDRNLLLAARNLHKISVCKSTSINPVSLITFDNTLMTMDSVRQIEEMLI